jgi:chitinase
MPPQTSGGDNGGNNGGNNGGSCANLPLEQRKDLVVVYWGQNQGGNEQTLNNYCQGSTYDIIIVSFLNNFGSGQPRDGNELNLGSQCWDNFADSGDSSVARLLRCPAIGTAVSQCQANGKKIVLSLGGAIGDYGFDSQAQAEATALHIWNRYLGGSTTYRPFGAAKLDGIDLDIENQKPQYYRQFVDRMRQLYATDSSKKYLIGAAPQCPFADVSMGPDGRAWSGAQLSGTVLGNSWIDFVSVQHYNNPMCEVGSADFVTNTKSWNDWAAKAVNPNVRVIIGFPGNSISAGSGFKSLAQIQAALDSSIRGRSNFGGLMYWDASTATGSGVGPQSSAWLKSVQTCSGNPNTQAPTQAATQAPTQAATQAPTQPATQAPTQAATQAPTKPATSAPTQAPTQAATQAPTQAPTQAATNPPAAGTRQCVGVALNTAIGTAAGLKLQWNAQSQTGTVEMSSTGAQAASWATCSSPLSVATFSSYLHFEVAGSCGAKSFRAFLGSNGDVVGVVSSSGDVVFNLKC